MKTLKHKLTTSSSFIGHAVRVLQPVCRYQPGRGIITNTICLGVEELMEIKIPSLKGAVSPINKFHSNI